MDRDQFDRLSRLVAAAGTRREALRLLAAGAIAGAAGGVRFAEARKRGNTRQRNGRARADQAQFCHIICLDCSDKPIRPGANLTRCNFSDRSFADGLDLRAANLSGACFARSELRQARFAGATLTNACFEDADLTGANFRGANVTGAVFCGADLSGADFRGSNVTREQLACATVGCSTTLPNGKPAVPCGKGLTCCNNLCVPTHVDPTNCGACGHGCQPLQVCRDGRCLLQAAPCLPPETDLQGAINAADPGATLTLCEGRFAAVNLIVTKNLAIVGAGRDKTILDGQGQSFVLTVQAGPSGTSNVSVTLISLTVTGSGAGRTALVNQQDFSNGAMPFLALSDVEVSNNNGTGVVNEGLASIGNGTRITNNTNSTFNGGGIYQAGFTSAAGIPGVSVSADSSVDHNTAQAGGGIFLAPTGTTFPLAGVFLQSASIVHDNSPNNCATEDPNQSIANCTN